MTKHIASATLSKKKNGINALDCIILCIMQMIFCIMSDVTFCPITILLPGLWQKSLLLNGILQAKRKCDIKNKIKRLI